MSILVIFWASFFGAQTVLPSRSTRQRRGDPVIHGMSVFHCHLLNHEDKGMMAKVLFK